VGLGLIPPWAVCLIGCKERKRGEEEGMGGRIDGFLFFLSKTPEPLGGNAEGALPVSARYSSNPIS